MYKYDNALEIKSWSCNIRSEGIRETVNLKDSHGGYSSTAFSIDPHSLAETGQFSSVGMIAGDVCVQLRAAQGELSLT